MARSDHGLDGAPLVSAFVAEARDMPGCGILRLSAWATILLPLSVHLLGWIPAIVTYLVLPIGAETDWLTRAMMGIPALTVAGLLAINALALVALVIPGRLGWLRHRLDRLPADGVSTVGLTILRVELLILLGAIPLFYLILMSDWLASSGSNMSMGIRVPILGIYGIAWFVGSTFLIRREIAKFRGQPRAQEVAT